VLSASGDENYFEEEEAERNVVPSRALSRLSAAALPPRTRSRKCPLCEPRPNPGVAQRSDTNDTKNDQAPRTRKHATPR